MLKTYITKPYRVQAIQYTCTNYTEIDSFIRTYYPDDKHKISIREDSITLASLDKLKQLNNAGHALSKLDRFIKIVMDDKVYEVFKDDYIALDQNKIIIFNSNIFNNKFIEEK